eukprot:bmy_08161T0
MHQGCFVELYRKPRSTCWMKTTLDKQGICSPKWECGILTFSCLIA